MRRKNPAAPPGTRVPAGRRWGICLAFARANPDAAEVPSRNAKASGFAIANERKMPHRRHRATLGQADAAVFCGPIHQTLPGKFRPPAEPPRQGSERQFEETARAALGADVIDQNKLAAGL